MATFKICTREDDNKRGYVPVYIRVIHKRKTAYIKTDKLILTSKVKNKEVTDAFILKTLSEDIIRYNDLLNKMNTSQMSVTQIVELIKQQQHSDICFSDYVRKFMRENKDVTHSTLLNYRSAINSLEEFMHTKKVMISYINSKLLQKWVDYLKANKPSSVSNYFYKLCKVYKVLMREVNDYDNNIIVIPHNPFSLISIPDNRKKIDKSIPVDVLRKIFSYETTNKRVAFALDVCKISFCLVGINLVDLYNLKKENVKGDLICYERQKTKAKRKDNAYIEIKIPDIIKPVLEKHRCNDESGLLLDLREKRKEINSLTAYINHQLNIVSANLHYEDRALTFYSFRHSWATIAANDLKAGIEEVAFALNHVSAHEITKGYIKTDFSSIWDLNQRVLDYVFNENKIGEQVETKCEQSVTQTQMKCNANAITGANIEYSNLLQISVYYQAKKTVEIIDIGFNSVDDVIAKVQELADEYDIIKVHNLDTNKVFVIKR
jgi:integrase